MSNEQDHIIQIYNDLKNLLEHYQKYKFKFDKTGKDIVRDDNANAEAFNILLVLTGTRDAMLLQSFEDQSKGQNGCEEIYQVMTARFNDLKELIQRKYNITTIRFYFQYNDVWIYNSLIQDEVDKKIGTREISDILRYGSTFPQNLKASGLATFTYNGSYFMGIRYEKANYEHMKKILGDQLEKFKPLAKKLDGNVSLTMK